MSQTSPLLSLPYIQPAQAKKHVTHNKALRQLDALVQLSVESRRVAEPPASPPAGGRCIVATGASGDWAGQDHAIALNAAGAWLFLPTNTGWRAWVVDKDTKVAWQDGLWQAQAGGVPDRIGLGTSADPVTRLSVASPDTLLTHEGAGHQLKVNKATSADTASLLFQTGWTGHAEMGLAGDDAFSIKVSDGATWTTALSFDPATGAASGLEESNPDALLRAGDGYLKGAILSPVTQDANGMPTGGVMERGSNANGDYVRFADGTQICTSPDIPTGPISNQAGALWQSNHLAWTFPAAFAPGVPPILTGESGNTSAWSTFAPHGVLSTGLKATALIQITLGLNLRICAIGRWI
ncbi:DUF2793 domain-containing protein [Marivita geojedonensis]|uniref:Uncharacterized protein n=1 Tax=Marivita geojedonensis TaxID=1123756 RepID=A0A1X4NBF2_9RHOB|nr:DUF2793 domain-containing protein [Marivita geojedonensis]OSQ43869.1 hypothetical protein MGEO_19410 [Marivita geojedonensis]PRY72500.1 uncharacterized protein DUF2793 [Marivita geojedonensis]